MDQPETKSHSWRQGVFGSLSSHAFRMFLTGAFISSIGSWLQTTSILWFVKDIGSDSLVGFVNMVAWVPTLFLGLFAGAMADRVDRKRLIIWCQVVMMVCSIGIGLTINIARSHELLIVAFLAISGIAYAFFIPAWISAMPFLIKREQILSANTMNNLQFNLAKFFGPVIAGFLLVSMKDYMPFYLNALTFGGFIILILLSSARMPEPVRDGPKMMASVVEGLRYVRANGWIIRVLAVLAGLSFFGFSFMVLLPAVCKEILHVKDHFYGILMGMTGLGALGGVLAVALLQKRVGFKAMMALGAAMNGAALIGLALSRSFILSCAMAAAAGGAFVVTNAAASAAVQRNVAPELEGRLSSMLVVAYIGVFPIGGWLLGFVSDTSSPEMALTLTGLACGLVALFALLFVRVPETRGAIVEQVQPEGNAP